MIKERVEDCKESKDCNDKSRSSTLSGQSTTHSAHYFESRTFRSPKWCNVCRGLLWGISRQGVKCVVCGVACHRKCAFKAEVASPCLPDIQLGSDDDDLSEDDPVEYNRQQFESAQVCSGVAEQELNLSIDEKTQSVVNSKPSTCEPSVKVTQYTARPSTPIYSRSGLLNSPPSLLSLSTSSSTKDTSQSLLGHSKGGLLKELIASSHEKATDIRGSPRLNVFTTLPKNFSRFVMKVGPLAEFQNSVEAILLWKSTPAMLAYVIVCLNPMLLLLAPHAIALRIVWNGYREANTFKSKRQRKSPTANANAPHASPRSAASLKPEQISYSTNMQFIQNTMGMYSDIYEQTHFIYSQINWNDDATVFNMVKWIVGSAMAFILCHPYVPWRVVLIMGGLSVFLLNTGMGRALQSYMLSQEWKVTGKELLLSVRQRIKDWWTRDQDSSEAIAVALVECYENQRFWAGLGWIPQLLKNERAAWSDASGSIALPDKQDSSSRPEQFIQLGTAVDCETGKAIVAADHANIRWKWQQHSHWTVDEAYTSSGDQSIVTDKEGWMYSNHSWTPQKSTGKRCLTRRRRWTRMAIGCSE